MWLDGGACLGFMTPVDYLFNPLWESKHLQLAPSLQYWNVVNIEARKVHMHQQSTAQANSMMIRINTITLCCTFPYQLLCNGLRMHRAVHDLSENWKWNAKTALIQYSSHFSSSIFKITWTCNSISPQYTLLWAQFSQCKQNLISKHRSFNTSILRKTLHLECNEAGITGLRVCVKLPRAV